MFVVKYNIKIYLFIFFFCIILQFNYNSFVLCNYVFSKVGIHTELTRFILILLRLIFGVVC